MITKPDLDTIHRLDFKRFHDDAESRKKNVGMFTLCGKHGVRMSYEDSGDINCPECTEEYKETHKIEPIKSSGELIAKLFKTNIHERINYESRNAR
jgi:hypothetical protein